MTIKKKERSYEVSRTTLKGTNGSPKGLTDAIF
jgi:hypothetical protein